MIVPHHPKSRRVGLALACAIIASVGLASCTHPDTSATSDTESAMSESMTVTITQNDTDQVHLDLPEGWSIVQNAATMPDFFLATPSEGESGGAIRLNRMSPEDLAFVYGHTYPDFPPFDLDVVAHYRESVSSDEQNEEVREVRELPARTIGDAQALGHSFQWTRADDPHFAQEWTLARRDGLWRVIARSATGGDSLSPEVLAALDTITWTPTQP